MKNFREFFEKPAGKTEESGDTNESIKNDRDGIEEKERLLGFLKKIKPFAENMARTYQEFLIECIYLKELNRIWREGGLETQKNIYGSVLDERRKLVESYKQAYENAKTKFEEELEKIAGAGFGEMAGDLKKTILEAPEIEDISGEKSEF